MITSVNWERVSWSMQRLRSSTNLVRLHMKNWTKLNSCPLGQDFKRVGLSTLTDILNVVAPPISEHEVIQVWLSHDMKGYDGVEALVYRSLAKVCFNRILCPPC